MGQINDMTPKLYITKELNRGMQ